MSLRGELLKRERYYQTEISLQEQAFLLRVEGYGVLSNSLRNGLHGNHLCKGALGGSVAAPRNVFYKSDTFKVGELDKSTIPFQIHFECSLIHLSNKTLKKNIKVAVTQFYRWKIGM